MLRWLVTPQGVVAATVALSAASWMVFDPSLPGGYKLAQPLTVQAVLILSAWYLMIIALAAIGFAAGRRVVLPLPVEADIARVGRLDSCWLYYLYSLVGLIGLAATYYRIAKLIGIDGIIASILNSGANQLVAALYSDYHIGILSLRYICALSGGIALWRLFLMRKWRLIHVVNILVLLVAVTTAGRLFLLTAIFIAVCLGMSTGRLQRISPIGALLAVAAILALIGVYSYIRTLGTYEHFGYGSFWQVALLQMGAYLSTPFQGALGVANHIGDVASLAQERDLFDLSPTYTTNSVLEYFVALRGGWAWLEIIPVSAGLAAAMGFARRFPETYLMCGYGVMLYAFAEMWRVPYYASGSFKTELVFALFLPLALAIGVTVLRRAVVERS